MKNLLLALVFIFVAGNAYADEIRVKVNGMVCAFCAQGIKKNFAKEKAVESIDVQLKDHLVTLKTSADISDEKIAELITKAGYEVRSIERKENKIN